MSKKITLQGNVKLVAVKRFCGKEQMLDYYIVVSQQKRIYAFSRKYYHSSYELCKSGIRINTLICKKCDNKAVMGLVEHLNRILPYLTEYHELPVSISA